MKTGTIKQFTDVKPYQKGQYTTYYANIEMDNGDKINIGLNKQPLVGMNFEYEITGDEGQHEYTQASVEWKSIKLPGDDSNQPKDQGTSKKWTEEDLNRFEAKDARITKLAVLKATCELLSGSSRNNAKDVKEDAQELLNWIYQD